MAESLEEAIDLLSDKSMEPDIMIVDYRLKYEQTGVAAIQMLRSHFGRCIPATIVTGNSSKSILQTVRKSGCRLLHKPLDAMELVREIAEVLEAEELALS